MFTHVLFSTQAALMGVPESQDLSLHRRASSFPFRYSAGHLWAEVTLCSPCSQKVKTHRLQRVGTKGAWKLLAPKVLGPL